MEALVVLVIGTILIVVLKKLPDKEHHKFLPDSVSKIFHRFKKAENQEKAETKEDIREDVKKEPIQDRSGEKADLLEKAERLLKEKKLKEAENLFIEVLKIDQKDEASYRGLGQICFERKNYKNALEVYKKLVEINLEDSSYHCNLGMCYFKEKKYKKAQDSYKKAIDIEEKTSYHKNLGITYYKLKKYEEAVSSLEKSLKMGEADQDSINLLIKILPKIKNKKKAKDILKFLLKLEPENTILKRELSRLK